MAWFWKISQTVLSGGALKSSMPNIKLAIKTLAVKKTGRKPKISSPDYWQEACAELMKQDRILRKLIPKYGDGI